MYLKVYYNLSGGTRAFATVDEVRAALPADSTGLTVTDAQDYIAVEFPAGARYNPDVVRVQRALRDAGFETE